MNKTELIALLSQKMEFLHADGNKRYLAMWLLNCSLCGVPQGTVIPEVNRACAELHLTKANCYNEIASLISEKLD